MDREGMMRLRFILFFFFLLGALALKLGAQASSFEREFSPSDPLTTLLESLPPCDFFADDTFSEGKKGAQTLKEERRRGYVNLKKAQGILERKRLRLKSTPLPDLMSLEEGQLPIETDDFSRYFFQYFTNAFSEVADIANSLESPHLYLRPLLELARGLYFAAVESSGQSPHPAPSVRRGVPDAQLQGWIHEWRLMHRKLERLSLTAEGSGVVNCVVQIIQRGVNLTQQLNNQRTRRGISPTDLCFMERCMADLIYADIRERVS